MYDPFRDLPPSARLPSGVLLFLFEAAAEMATQAYRAHRRRHHRPLSRGATLRPGDETPLWNELRRQLRPHLREYGDQANLGRVIGLPRQRINAFVTGGGQMPDAERTLQLLAWLHAQRRRRRR